MKEKLIEKDGLLAPEGFWDLTAEEKERLFNKCGGDPITSFLVPNYILNRSVSLSCEIHDYQYINGQTPEDKKNADQIFAQNIDWQVSKDSTGFLKYLRKGIGKIYAWAASIFGHFYYRKSNSQSL